MAIRRYHRNPQEPVEELRKMFRHYLRLILTGQEGAAEHFLIENANNTEFVEMIRMSRLVAKITLETLDAKRSAEAEEDPNISQALSESWLENLKDEFERRYPEEVDEEEEERRNPKQLTFPWYREPVSPKQVRELPPMTDIEFFWGSPEQISNEKFWFRAFKALPGKPYQDYFHIYTWRPLRSNADLKKIVTECVRESIVTKQHGEHGKIVIQCCPYQNWDPLTQRCIVERPRDGKRPHFYKVLIPQNDLDRLLRLGLARRAKKRIRRIPVSQYHLRGSES